jgi:hypothetical protein
MESERFQRPPTGSSECIRDLPSTPLAFASIGIR